VTEKSDGWLGVFCSEECKEDARTVRAIRDEISTGKLTPGTRAMHAVWADLVWWEADYQKTLPERSAALYERVFFPLPVYPADREEWTSTWQSWRKARQVSERHEVYDFSSPVDEYAGRGSK
jgi:hypothetical protein